MRYFVKQNDGTMVPRRRTRDELNAKFDTADKFLVAKGLGLYEEKKHGWCAYRNSRFRRRFGRHIGCLELTRQYPKSVASDDDSGSIFFLDV